MANSYDKYKYTYEKTANYCYKGTDILINKLNITNDDDLYKAERELVAIRTAEFVKQPIKGNFDFNHLKLIHKYLFQDIYNWADDIRNCNIAKQDLFCLAEYINTFGNNIFETLKEEKYFLEYNYDKKIEKLVNLFADINALHPFREGNGRTQREFIEELAKINGIMLDLTSVDKMDMIIASHDSINGNYEKLINTFKENSAKLNKEETENYINKYCNKEIIKIIKNI